MELVKELRKLQEQILQEEKERYEKGKEAFEKNDPYLFESPYVQSKDIDQVLLEDYGITPESLIIMCNKTKELIKEHTKRGKYKAVKTYPYKYDVWDRDWDCHKIFCGFMITWRYLMPEDSIKEKAKRRFSDEVSDRVYKKAKTILDQEQVYYKRNVDCFLLEKFMNEQVDFDFLVEATYRTCNI